MTTISIRTRIANSKGFDSWESYQAAVVAEGAAEAARIAKRIESERAMRRAAQTVVVVRFYLYTMGAGFWFGTPEEHVASLSKHLNGERDYSDLSVYHRRPDGRVVRDNF